MSGILKGLKWLVLLLLLAVVSAYGIARSGSKPLDQAARDQLGGDYLQTAQGVLSYTRQGPVDAPVIILVHGFSTPKFVWEQVTPTLLAAGYQLITYDHLGRGFSDRPAGPYNAALYRSELAGLITGLELATPLTLVGYSMGGANVVDFAAANPTLVKHLLLIAPAGYMRNADSLSLSLLNTPLLAEWLITVFGKQYARGAIKSEIEAGLAPADMLDKFDQQAAYSGYTDALLSTFRHYPMGDLADRYRIVGATDIPVTAIWGTADKIVHYRGAALMAEDVGQLKLITLQGGNHNIAYARAEEVAAALISALHPVAP
ncbi:MAG: pimeloyl-ACP methyl ester carboxylesterase [Halioglobus sp.]|jgi:pimeloyl-ACP methyl ester carboxylesterase